MSAIRVLRQVKAANGWKLVAVAKKGDVLDWGLCVIDGKPKAIATGTFYLEYRDAGRKTRRAVGSSIREAKAALSSQRSVLELRSRGIEAEDTLEISSRRPRTGKPIATIVTEFCSALPLGIRPKSWTKYKFDLQQFQAWQRSADTLTSPTLIAK